MIPGSTLSAIADAIEADAAIATTTNRTRAGFWERIALAAEAIAGASTTANDNSNGWLLRAALALEAKAGSSLSADRGYNKLEARVAYAASVLGATSVLNKSIGQAFLDGITAYSGAPAVAPGFATALYDLDFRLAAPITGGAYTTYLAEVGNFAGGLYEMESDGSLVAVGGSALQRASDGLEVWPSRTNRALQNRNLTDAAWTLANVTAARSAGRTGVANSGSRITVTTNGGTAMLGAITLASNTQIGSVDVKRVSGAGTVEMTVDGGTTCVALAGISSTWTRPSIPAQTLANPQIGLRFGTAGDVFDIDYVQCEDSNTVGPRIATTTAAVNRPQNRATCLNKPPLRDLIKSDTYTAYWEGRIDALGGKGIFISDAGFNFSIAADGSCAALGISAGEFQFGVYQKIAISKNGASDMRTSLNGGPIRIGTTGTHAAITHFDVSTNGAGAFNGRGKVKRITFWNTRLDDATLQTVST